MYCGPLAVHHNCANISCVALGPMQQLICCHFYGFPATNHSLTSLMYVISVPHMICWHTLAFDLLLYQATKIYDDLTECMWPREVIYLCSQHPTIRQSVFPVARVYTEQRGALLRLRRRHQCAAIANTSACASSNFLWPINSLLSNTC